MSQGPVKHIDDLRRRLARRIFTQSEVPMIVYFSVVFSMALLYWASEHSELAADFLPEIFGAAFTLFIIDVLLVRSKNKRWKMVRDDVDYLIARSVNRLRDGLSIRAFGFKPDLHGPTDVRTQRRVLLSSLEGMELEGLSAKMAEQELFSNDTYAYFNERAADLWSILNMKYAEYLSPVLVSQLISLHIALKDAGSHIRQYRKADRFVEDKDWYRQQARHSMAATLKQVLELVNALQREGYSELARSA